jgi:hypothetical protein
LDHQREQDARHAHLEVRTMARKFFYIAAGMLMLALVYHLGSGTAGAQGFGLGLVCKLDGTDMYGTQSYCSPSGDIFQYWNGHWAKTSNVFGGAPGARTIISYGSGVALASNGEVFASVLKGWGPWTSLGFPAGGPTPALHESWGQLKSRYRATPQATPGTTVTPGASDR